MERAEIDSLVTTVVKRSRIGAITTALIAIMIAGSSVYFAKRIEELSQRANSLAVRLSSLQRNVDAKQAELKDSQEQLNAILRGLDYLNDGTRKLLDREYGDAIGEYGEFLKVFPENPQALNFAGYAELRYAEYWRENAARTGITSEQRAQFSENTKKYFQAAEQHLQAAAGAKSEYVWATYNAVLLYFQNGMYARSLDTLADLLNKDPTMVVTLCDDGQFRKMRLNHETASRFVSIVSGALQSADSQSCWVTKAPRA